MEGNVRSGERGCCGSRPEDDCPPGLHPTKATPATHSNRQSDTVLFIGKPSLQGQRHGASGDAAVIARFYEKIRLAGRLAPAAASSREHLPKGRRGRCEPAIYWSRSRVRPPVGFQPSGLQLNPTERPFGGRDGVSGAGSIGGRAKPSVLPTDRRLIPCRFSTGRGHLKTRVRFAGRSGSEEFRQGTVIAHQILRPPG